MTKLEKFLITYLFISQILAMVILIIEVYNIKITLFLIINPFATIATNMVASYIQDKKGESK